MTRGGRSAAALLFALLLAVSPIPTAHAQSVPLAGQAITAGPDGYVHIASGFRFPPQLGQVKAVGERVFEASNVMVRYGSEGPESKGAWFDLYVYPARGPLDDEAAEVGQIILERYGAQPAPPPRPLPRIASDGRAQWYSATIENRPSRTGYIIVRRGGWSMKVRATVPNDTGDAELQRILDGIAAVPWDWAPAKAPDEAEKVVAFK